MVTIDLSRDSLFDSLGLIRLHESYMTENEKSPQERFAYVAEKFGSNPEHAQRIYNYAAKHWLSFSTPVLSYGRTKNGLPISCFSGDTWVSVKSCGAKQIKDVMIGDEVLTHKGRWKRVINTRKSTSKDIYEIKINARGTKTHVTGNHLLLTNMGWKRVDELDGNHLIATNALYNDIEKNYIINNIDAYYISNTNVNSGAFSANTINNNIEIDDELAWALGLWFAEGSTTKNGSVTITMHKDEIEIVNKWKSIMIKKFGVSENTTKASISSDKKRGNSWSSASVFSKILSSWFDGSFNKGAKDKHIPQWILELPKSKLQHFWDGCFLGDGCKTTHTKQIVLSNPKLITQLYHILLKLDMPNLSYNIQKKNLNWLKREDKTTITSQLGILTRDVGVRFGDHIFRKIDYIEKIDIGEIEVYDIMVDEDESFTVNGFIAHNCFLPYMHDSSEGLVNTLSETNWLSMLGGGVGIGIGIRAKDDRSTGIMPHLKVYDAACRAYQQGSTRRGSYATYLDISHPDIEMFLDIRKETGDPNLRAPNLHHGINVSDAFMKIIENCMIDPNADDSWQLINPNNGEVRKIVSAKYLWQKILDVRMETGEPYLHFIDTSNRALPQHLKNLGLSIKQSNLCSEIMLPTNKDRTAVCCLSSVVMEQWDEWKDDPLFLSDVLEFLDNVLQVFIDTAPNVIERAIYSAKMERSVGVGVLGFHSYLQKHNIPFESLEAIDINNKFFKSTRDQLDIANIRLGIQRGEAPDAKGTGKRLSHVMAIAPNASSSIIVGNSSPSIEPYRANAYSQVTLSGKKIVKNKYFSKLLAEKYSQFDADEIWSSIMSNDGSVQHLDFLTEHEKKVFKTALEIDQKWIILHASTRQRFIDQGQSLNLFFKPTVNITYLHNCHFLAWKSGCKALYYCRSEKVKSADKVGDKVERQIIPEEIGNEQADECLACEG